MRLAVPVALAGLLLTTTAYAVSLGQTDDFENTTTQGWKEGNPSPNPPSNAVGGPDGPNDRYLRNVSSGSSGAGGRMTMFNTTQWTGDFLAAGIGRIHLKARVFGTEGLTIRILFRRAGSGPNGLDTWITSPQVLPADEQWHAFDFSLAVENMSSAGGLSSHTQMMTGAEQMWIANYPGTSGQPPRIQATLGIDDITALEPEALPEPEAPAIDALPIVLDYLLGDDDEEGL
jgi:hypothetical protein